MSFVRRKFLKKSLLGLLAVSLLPPSISFLSKKGRLFSANELFAQLSFKKRVLSPDYINENFKLSNVEVDQITRNGKVFYTEKTVFIQEYNHYGPGLKDIIMSVYEKTADGYEKVISLNHIELKAFSNVVTYLQEEHDISNSDDLQKLLIPTLKSRKHIMSDNRVDGESSSAQGYYTAQGYCSMKITAKGNRYKIDTRLFSFRKSAMYKNSFQLRGVA